LRRGLGLPQRSHRAERLGDRLGGRAVPLRVPQHGLAGLIGERQLQGGLARGGTRRERGGVVELTGALAGAQLAELADLVARGVPAGERGMHFLRLAESTELNNAWIVGAAAAGALIVLWLAVALSIFLVRQAGHMLQIQALRSFVDGYARRARLVTVIVSFAVA